jgi:fructose transport system permease protein
MAGTTTTPEPLQQEREEKWSSRLFASPAAGPFVALILAVAIFSVTTDTFLTTNNFSLVLQQAVVIGTLALGQTLIILTGGIDLANGAIMVMGTIVMAKYAVGGGNPLAALLIALILCTIAGAVTGLLVTQLNLPPFIVTLGMLAVLTAGTRLYSQGQSFPVLSDLLSFLGREINLGAVSITYGSLLLIVLYVVFWYLLGQTAWGRHVYAVGNNREAARLTGINTKRVLMSVYVVAGVLYGVAAWQALGRIPNADANSYQTANLDSITAVVIGGTSLFGGRGGVVGTLVGTLIVGVLRSGLTQAGIDALYQDLATGILVIVAVAFDQLTRRRRQL